MTISNASSTPPTVPVTWLSFTAKEKEGAVQTNWSTAFEQNTKDFVVQHKAKEGNWNSVGMITAAGNSSTVQQYSFLHSFPVNGINYYRILQRDIDGRINYSKVLAVNISESRQSLYVYPNPATGGIINITLQRAAQVHIYNSLGACQKVCSQLKLKANLLPLWCNKTAECAPQY
jgi:hypothetical protein